MIVSTTPLRISFFGGGSDIPEYYTQYGGVVMSTAIDKCVRIAAHFCEPKRIRVVYSRMETVDKVEDLRHDRVREVLKEFGVESNFEMCSFSDVSTRGTGLGSSSTFTVGLINAISELKLDTSSSPYDIAEMACKIEIEKCCEPIGKQDQYAAAFGGFNLYQFDRDGSVNVIRYSKFTSRSTLAALSDNLMCFSTNKTRNASTILKDQVSGLKSGLSVSGTHQLVQMVNDAITYLKKEKLSDFGRLLDDAWQVKKSLATGITDPDIDEMYELGMKHGALGGKLLGAGGGGYMLFYVPITHQAELRLAMDKAGYNQFNFKINSPGTRIASV